jgi:hypothetical protein
MKHMKQNRLGGIDSSLLLIEYFLNTYDNEMTALRD